MRVFLFAFVISGALLAQPVKVGTFAAESRTFFKAPQLPSDDVRDVRLGANGEVFAVTAAGAVTMKDGKWIPATIAAAKPANVEARKDGLFVRNAKGAWERQFPNDGAGRSWAPVDVRGAAYDAKGRLWFASPQGVGVRETDGKWKLYTGADGLPYDDFTAVAPGEDGVIWFGTRIGAIRFDGKTWEYRQGLRWLPNDEVRAIAVDSKSGNAWIATAGGLALIERKPLTLADKARVFEAEIDKRHRRTPYEYVHPVILDKPGDTSKWTQTDSDNDGLWTSMYGAGECYAYGATGREEFRIRAKKAFEALRFLRIVTQGGEHPAPTGFIARSILPVSGRNPNVHDSPQHDAQRRAERDHRWKIIDPRWPKNGEWYWKTDTSSDELDGHYFFYGLYYDLVAKTEEEKQRVREHVAAITDHLLVHNYALVDHDGKVTRWAVFGPEEINHNQDWWQERGMNSLSILAYLKVAEHITGDARYAKAARTLIEVHGYATNTLITKTHLGPGAGNQSDDEMIFMNYYSLLKYEKDPQLRQKYLRGFRSHWDNEQPEMNPVFNFLYAAVGAGGRFEDAFGVDDLSPQGPWLEDSIDTLKRLPLDRIDWALKNSHRKDIVRLPANVREGNAAVGHRVNGKVLPIDERFVGHWNHDPWTLDSRGGGRTLADGGVFLLPYYMGLYHGFVAPE